MMPGLHGTIIVFGVLSSGYIFYDLIRRSRRTGHDFYFRTVVTGVFLLCLSYITLLFFERRTDSLVTLVNQLAPDFFRLEKKENLFILSPFLALLFATGCKLVYEGYVWIDVFILDKLHQIKEKNKKKEKDGNKDEEIPAREMTEREFKREKKDLEKKAFVRYIYEKAMAGTYFVTAMSNGKVYVGWIYKFFIDSKTEWIRFEVVEAGYRKENGEVEILEEYYEEDLDRKPQDKDFIYLPIAEIVAMQAFD